MTIRYLFGCMTMVLALVAASSVRSDPAAAAMEGMTSMSEMAGMSSMSAKLPPLSAANLRKRFAILSRQSSNRCTLTPAGVDQMPSNAALQGSCCGPMQYSDYVRQTNGLKKYTGDPLVPSDPYDMSVGMAKHLIALDSQINLDAAQQQVYDQAVKLSPDKGPCCCHCWRWTAFQGQARDFIARRNYSANQVAEIWGLDDGCGSGNMSMMNR